MTNKKEKGKSVSPLENNDPQRKVSGKEIPLRKIVLERDLVDAFLAFVELNNSNSKREIGGCVEEVWRERDRAANGPSEEIII